MTAVAQTTPTRLRLTRRGRIVFTSLGLVPAVVAGIVIGALAPSAAGDNTQTSVEMEYVTMYAGQTLWSLAETIAPNEDPRDVINEILDLNGINETEVTVGTRLAVPDFGN